MHATETIKKFFNGIVEQTIFPKLYAKIRMIFTLFIGEVFR